MSTSSVGLFLRDTMCFQHGRTFARMAEARASGAEGRGGRTNRPPQHNLMRCSGHPIITPPFNSHGRSRSRCTRKGRPRAPEGRRNRLDVGSRQSRTSKYASSSTELGPSTSGVSGSSSPSGPMQANVLTLAVTLVLSASMASQFGFTQNLFCRMMSVGDRNRDGGKTLFLVRNILIKDCCFPTDHDPRCY